VSRKELKSKDKNSEKKGGYSIKQKRWQRVGEEKGGRLGKLTRFCVVEWGITRGTKTRKNANEGGKGRKTKRGERRRE